MTEEVVRMRDVDVSIKRALVLHIRDAKHPGQDVKLGCKTCSLFMALPWNLQRHAVVVEIPE